MGSEDYAVQSQTKNQCLALSLQWAGADLSRWHIRRATPPRARAPSIHCFLLTRHGTKARGCQWLGVSITPPAPPPPSSSSSSSSAPLCARHTTPHVCAVGRRWRCPPLSAAAAVCGGVCVSAAALGPPPPLPHTSPNPGIPGCAVPRRCPKIGVPERPERRVAAAGPSFFAAAVS